MKDYTRLWVRLIWYVQSCPMRIFKWIPDFNPSTPLRIDSHNVNRVKLGTAFVCVELDVSKPLMNETWISFVDDEDPTIVFDGFWQKVEYDDVPPYCLKCFRMGHKVEDCKRDFEKEQGKGPQAPYVHRRRLYRRVLNPTKAVQPKATVNDVKKKGPLDPVIVGHVTSSSGTKESDLAPPLIRLGHVVEKWIKKLHTKNNGQGKNKQEGVQTNNSFACLENVLEEEKDIAEDAKRNSMAKEVTVGKNNVHTTAQTNNTFAGLQNVLEDENDAMAETKGSLRDEGDHTTVGEEHVQTNNSFAGLEDISTDFQEDMSTFCKEFKAPSATSSPKVSLLMATDSTQQWILPSEEKSGVDCHLLDAGFVGSKYTWTNGKLSQRLDRELVHHLDKGKDGGNVMMKLCMTKAFNMLSWEFLTLILAKFRFAQV
ncbi:hypothetical protein LIER_34811 [Lithospermum erythrorhizon]|uniref:DUF4283 domain-containing protein n=1 Tax=Lithospermum erythrorhizon TaxID=34254 RepID=A0AAV3S2B4_LITER